MYSSFALAKKYLRYYLTAYNGKGHGMHSPFVFQFILHVLNNGSAYHAPPEIERLRQHLLRDDSVLQIEDLGAGSRVTATKERKVKALAASALKPKKYAQLLHRLVCHYKPATMLELGTSLGITTAYLAAGNAAGRMVSIEGSSAVADIARQNFERLRLRNITLLQGNFDELLPVVLKQHSTVDLAYIDGNHRYAPTLRYFEALLPKMHNNSVLVFDDIHWSAEMEAAWKAIQNHPAVLCTVDVFFLGFVFFRKEFKAKQQFAIRF